MTVLTFDEVIANHLQAHPIPIHTTMVDACKISIESMNNGDWNKMVELPYNVHARRYSTWEREQSIPAWKVVALCHLEKWLDKEVAKKFDAFMKS